MVSTVQGTKATSAAKPPRGRRRFMADLREAIECAENGEGYVAESYMVQGVLTCIVTCRVYPELKRVSPALRSGDDEAILCDIVSLETGDTIVSLSINITGELPSSFMLVWGYETMLMMCLPRDKDTSEYPKDHSFFAYTQDDGGSQVSQRILSVIETIPDLGSRSIDELLRRLVGAFEKASRVQKGKGKESSQPSQSQQTVENDTDSEGGDDEDVGMYDMEDDMADFVDARHKNIDGAVLLR